jgi:hypothetical protein
MQRNVVARNMKYLQGKGKFGSTTMVTIWTSNGARINLTAKEDMEQAIMQSNLAECMKVNSKIKLSLETFGRG